MCNLACFGTYKGRRRGKGHEKSWKRSVKKEARKKVQEKENTFKNSRKYYKKTGMMIIMRFTYTIFIAYVMKDCWIKNFLEIGKYKIDFG